MLPNTMNGMIISSVWNTRTKTAALEVRIIRIFSQACKLTMDILLNLRRHSNHRRNRWTTPLIEWYIDQSRVNAYLLHDEIVWSYNSDSTTNPNEKVTKLEQRELNYRPCARASTSSKPQHLEPRPSEQNNHTSDHALVLHSSAGKWYTGRKRCVYNPY